MLKQNKKIFYITFIARETGKNILPSNMPEGERGLIGNNMMKLLK